MTDPMILLLAASGQATCAAADMIAVTRDGKITPHDMVGAGETLNTLAAALRLLIDAMDSSDEDATQLHGAVIRFLDAQT